jgi:hypothetical protein
MGKNLLEGAIFFGSLSTGKIGLKSLYLSFNKFRVKKSLHFRGVEGCFGP